VSNIIKHSGASHCKVRCAISDRQFGLTVQDNGKGIAPEVLAEGGLAGHHGLPGMRERARLAGGKLTIVSRLHAGTEIELTIPASLAYSTSPPRPATN